MRESCAVLDIGSSSVIALIGENGVNDTFNILGKGEVAYAGFQNSEFLEPENLKLVVAQALSNAEMTSDTKVTEIYVGVPGEFCSVVTKAINLTFPKQKRISKFDIENIFKTGDDFAGNPEYELVNHSVIYFELDGAKRVIDPTSMKAKSVTGNISYILAQREYIKMLNAIFAELKIKVKGFISSNLAECLYLFEPSVRDKYVLLVDVGYITTNVMLARGNSLLFLNSFSLGGGYITSDLSQCLKISFGEAERLKHKIVLGWTPSASDTYEIDGDEYKMTYSAKATNEIATDRIEMICDYIVKCLDNCVYDLPDFLPIHFVGGAFNFIRGIKTVLTKKFKRRVNLVTTRNMIDIRPYDASEEGLLYLQLNHEEIIETLLV